MCVCGFFFVLSRLLGVGEMDGHRRIRTGEGCWAGQGRPTVDNVQPGLSVCGPGRSVGRGVFCTEQPGSEAAFGGFRLK